MLKTKYKYYLSLIATIVIFSITSAIADNNNSSNELQHNEDKKEYTYIEHKVSKGDNLHLLAAYYYNNSRQWQRIYESNKDILTNPNILSIGVVLKIPIDKTTKFEPKFNLNDLKNGQ